MLSNLLINYTSGIYSARRKKKLALAQGPPRAVREASSRSFDGSAATAAAAVNTTTTAYSASSNSAPASTTASFNIPPNNIPPAVTISLTAGNSSSGGGALPSLKVTSPTPIILAPLTPTHDDNQVNEAQPPSSSNDSSLIPASVISNLPGITSTPPPQTEHPLNNLASNSNYFASSTTHNGLLERIKGFSRRKSQETPDRKLKSGGKKSEENDEEESGSNNNTMAIPPALARSTSSLGNGLQGEESVLNPVRRGAGDA